MTDQTRHIMLAAGGTGGHIYPAYALAAKLLTRGHKVSLITDTVSYTHLTLPTK